MIGFVPPPTPSKSHSQGSGFQGSPVEPKRRRAERSAASHVAGLAQRSHERGRDAQERHSVALGEPPHAARLGIVGRAVVEHGREPEAVRVGEQPGPHDPADVGHPVDAVARLEVARVAALGRDLDEKAPVHVHGALGPAGRARGVGEHERVLGLDRRRSPCAGAPVEQLVPPDVAALLPLDRLPGVAHDDDVAHPRRAGDRLVRRGLGGHGTSLAQEGVDRDQRDSARVLQPAGDGRGREAREDRHDHRTDRSGRVVGDRDLGRHRHEQRDRIAAPHPERLQALRAAGDLAGQVGVAERARGARLVLPGDRLDAGMGRVVGPALDAGVREVEPAVCEPARPGRAVREVEHLAVGRREGDPEVARHRVPEARRLGGRELEQLVVAVRAERARERRGVRGCGPGLGRDPGVLAHSGTVRS